MLPQLRVDHRHRRLRCPKFTKHKPHMSCSAGLTNGVESGFILKNVLDTQTDVDALKPAVVTRISLCRTVLTLSEQALRARLSCLHLFRSSATLRTDSVEEWSLQRLLSQDQLQKAEQGGNPTDVVCSVSARVFLDCYVSPPWNRLSAGSWSHHARRSLHVGNAGGSSAQSECVSIQYMCDRFRATDVLLEMEVQYVWRCKLTDFICTINGHRVGVSVTRAMSYPSVGGITFEQAQLLLLKKLEGLVIACAGVCEKQAFSTSILHVFVSDATAGEVVCQAYRSLIERGNEMLDLDYEARIRDIVVLVTVCALPVIFSTKLHTATSPTVLIPFPPPPILISSANQGA